MIAAWFASLLLLLEPKPVMYTRPVAPIVIVKQIEFPIPVPKKKPVQEPVCTGSFCSCIVFLREDRGANVRGDAKDLVPNYFGVPQEGDIALFKYSTGASHAAYVFTSFTDKAFYVHEANFKMGQYTERAIMVDDPFLIGFIRN